MNGQRATEGNTIIGSNNAISRVFGTAVGADYRFSAYTPAGFALAGGGTSFGVPNGGGGRSDLFRGCAYLRRRARLWSPLHSPSSFSDRSQGS
jgi:hypothetical protein